MALATASVRVHLFIRRQLEGAGDSGAGLDFVGLSLALWYLGGQAEALVERVRPTSRTAGCLLVARGDQTGTADSLTRKSASMFLNTAMSRSGSRTIFIRLSEKATAGTTISAKPFSGTRSTRRWS